MANIRVAVINASTVLTDEQVQAAVPALQTQVRRDFAPAWGIDADLSFVPCNAIPDPGLWWLTVLDDSDQAGALGYHDVTDEGLPLGKVFARADLRYGSQWTVTASHEFAEAGFEVVGIDVQQSKVDEFLNKLDGTPNKTGSAPRSARAKYAAGGSSGISYPAAEGESHDGNDRRLPAGNVPT